MTAEAAAVPCQAQHLQIAQEIEDALQRHVIDAWFPRCIDPSGGYFSDFDRRWRPGKSRERMLEFQARQTRVAARLAAAYPSDGRWQEYALHGFRCLRDQMWDRDHGGWFWRIAADGSPLEAATKHSHSSAYAVQGAALVYEVTGERASLELAEEALEWFNRHAHDEEFGGFHSWLTRGGTVIRMPADVPPGCGRLDPLGHEVGLKDINVLGDWVEALLDLTVNSSSPVAAKLLDEFTAIYLDRATTGTGEVHYAFHPNWLPQPGLEWYGYGFEAAQRMLYAAAYLPQFPALKERARAMALRTILLARLRAGGFAYAGPGGTPAFLEGHRMVVPTRSWWVQFDGLRVLAFYAASEREPGPFTRRLIRHWEFMKREMLDDRFGGVYSSAHSDRPWRSRLARREHWSERKGRDWKDASHETAALLESASVLRGEPRRHGRKDVLPV